MRDVADIWLPFPPVILSWHTESRVPERASGLVKVWSFLQSRSMSRVSSGVISFALAEILLGLDKVHHLKNVAKSGCNMSFEIHRETESSQMEAS